jgi:hypothetical protein
MLIAGLKVLDKRYSTADHVKKIIISLLKNWRHVVTNLKLAKDLNNISLEELVSSLRSHEIELEEDEPHKRGKFVVLKSKPEKTKSYQVEEESKGSGEDSEDDELSLISKRVNRLWRHRQNGQGKFRGARRTVGRSNSSSGPKKQGSGKKVVCYECKEPDHYKTECHKLKKVKRPKKKFSKGKNGLMATWDDSESEEEDFDEE